MAKQKRTEFKEYINKRLENIEELSELCDLLSLDIEDEATKHIVLARIYSICAAIEDERVAKQYVDRFNETLSARNYDECYKVVMKIFYHCFIPIRASLVTAPKKLNRKLLVPIRSSLGDIIYAVLAAFRCDCYHLVELTGSEFRFEPSYTMNEESDCADAYPSFIIYDLKNPEVCYDFGENWTFRLSPRKTKMIMDDSFWDSVILEDGAGYGILEDNRFILEQYFETGELPVEELENMGYDELLAPGAIDLNEFNLEEQREYIEGDFQFTRDSYVFGPDSDENYTDIDDSENDTIS